MSGDTSSSAGNAALVVSGTGAAITGTSGVISAINEYAVVIGLSLSLISIIIGIIFHIHAYLWRNQDSAENRAKLTREIIKELEKEKNNKPD